MIQSDAQYIKTEIYREKAFERLNAFGNLGYKSSNWENPGTNDRENAIMTLHSGTKIYWAWTSNTSVIAFIRKITYK